MEALIQLICGYIALSVEAVAAVVIAYGMVEAFVWHVPELIRSGRVGRRRDVLRRFGIWLLLGLEFELAADIVRTAISPTWTDIGQLASIAVIRTFLSCFLEADITKLRQLRNDQD